MFSLTYQSRHPAMRYSRSEFHCDKVVPYTNLRGGDYTKLFERVWMFWVIDGPNEVCTIRNIKLKLRNEVKRHNLLAKNLVLVDEFYLVGVV